MSSFKHSKNLGIRVVQCYLCLQVNRVVFESFIDSTVVDSNIYRTSVSLHFCGRIYYLCTADPHFLISKQAFTTALIAQSTWVSEAVKSLYKIHRLSADKCAIHHGYINSVDGIINEWDGRTSERPLFPTFRIFVALFYRSCANKNNPLGKLLYFSNGSTDLSHLNYNHEPNLQRLLGHIHTT